MEEYKPSILIKELGMRFPTEKSKERARYGLYKCGYCGKEFEANISYINSKSKKCCGCTFKNPVVTTHGLSKHRLYGVWKAMLSRCNSPKDTAYHFYGGRGISVCQEWHNVKTFIEDMYPSYEEGLSIDRIDVEGDYTPLNCRWADDVTQGQNKRLLISTNKTGYRGVSLRKDSGKYRVMIDVRGKVIRLGCYETAEEAALIYDQYVIDNKLGHPTNILSKPDYNKN